MRCSNSFMVRRYDRQSFTWLYSYVNRNEQNQWNQRCDSKSCKQSLNWGRFYNISLQAYLQSWTVKKEHWHATVRSTQTYHRARCRVKASEVCFLEKWAQRGRLTICRRRWFIATGSLRWPESKQKVAFDKLLDPKAIRRRKLEASFSSGSELTY